MTYERIKTGTFRVCVFLTVLGELLAVVGSNNLNLNKSTAIFGFYFGHLLDFMVFLPIFIWSTYFFGLWIAKGFIGQK